MIKHLPTPSLFGNFVTIVDAQTTVTSDHPGTDNYIMLNGYLLPILAGNYTTTPTCPTAATTRLRHIISACPYACRDWTNTIIFVVSSFEVWKRLSPQRTSASVCSVSSMVTKCISQATRISAIHAFSRRIQEM
jgi:hypothetical protein